MPGWITFKDTTPCQWTLCIFWKQQKTSLLPSYVTTWNICVYTCNTNYLPLWSGYECISKIIVGSGGILQIWSGGTATLVLMVTECCSHGNRIMWWTEFVIRNWNLSTGVDIARNKDNWIYNVRSTIWTSICAKTWNFHLCDGVEKLMLYSHCILFYLESLHLYQLYFQWIISLFLLRLVMHLYSFNLFFWLLYLKYTTFIWLPAHVVSEQNNKQSFLNVSHYYGKSRFHCFRYPVEMGWNTRISVWSSSCARLSKWCETHQLAIGHQWTTRITMTRALSPKRERTNMSIIYSVR